MVIPSPYWSTLVLIPAVEQLVVHGMDSTFHLHFESLITIVFNGGLHRLILETIVPDNGVDCLVGLDGIGLGLCFDHGYIVTEPTEKATIP